MKRGAYAFRFAVILWVMFAMALFIQAGPKYTNSVYFGANHDDSPQYHVRFYAKTTNEVWFYLYDNEGTAYDAETDNYTGVWVWATGTVDLGWTPTKYLTNSTMQTNISKFAVSTNDARAELQSVRSALLLKKGNDQRTYAVGEVTVYPAPEW